MLRLGEVVLAVAPLLLALLLYGVVYHRVPSRRAVLAIAVAELAMAASLFWQSETESLQPHERYIPAQMHDGDVLSGHGRP